MDVHILMSVVNMKLRNEFSSLRSLCASFELDEKSLVAKLAKDSYVYESDQNQFRSKPFNSR
ncbi:MAG: DUF4250 domain-containing protein [Colwellia sp.]